MNTTSKQAIVAVLLCIASIGIVLSIGAMAVWLTAEARVLPLVILPTVIVASLLVVYFDWRAKLLDRIRVRDERHEHKRVA